MNISISLSLAPSLGEVTAVLLQGSAVNKLRTLRLHADAVLCPVSSGTVYKLLQFGLPCSQELAGKGFEAEFCHSWFMHKHALVIAVSEAESFCMQTGVVWELACRCSAYAHTQQCGCMLSQGATLAIASGYATTTVY